MIVTLRHVLTVPGFNARGGFCRDGARRWARAQGLDWRAFVRHGIDAETLRATGDPLAAAVCDWAQRCEGGH